MTETFDIAQHIFHSPELVSIVDDAIRFFISTPLRRLPPAASFIGSGVYSLYYTGDYPLYAALAAANRHAVDRPIYVGKAVPPGWRTARAKDSETPDIMRRLQEHTRSIQQTENLRIEDFQCRFMILSGLEGDLIVPIEAGLIRRFKPIWNSVVDGFGNHDPGSGRYDQAKSAWDVLHPGRPWAAKLKGRAPDQQAVIESVKAALTDLN